MSRRTVSRRRYGSHPLIGFLLVASFGILFAGCSGPQENPNDELVFTQEDIARFRNLAQSGETGTGPTGATVTPSLEPLESGSGARKEKTVVLDLSNVETYTSMRAGGAQAANVYQVTNDFLNIREKPSTGAAQVGRLVFGNSVELIAFVDSQWAQVKAGNIEGYAAHKYLSKVTTEERLADEKKAFEGKYYVSYGFVNMRKEPKQESEKLVEIPGGTILRGVKVENGWGKVTYDGKEGYVSMQFLSSLLPNFIVRQETYELPVLHYQLTKDQSAPLLAALSTHATALREKGYSFMTMKALRDLLTAQQSRDVRLDPKKVIIAISGVSQQNMRAVSDTLTTAAIPATLFIETENIGLSGITEKNLLTLMANGFDVQSGTHTGDDLRALTNAQVKLELEQSRKILEDYTKKPVFAVAYGQGGVNDRVAQIAADAGYLLGLGSDADRTFSRSQLLEIPALPIFPSMTVDEVVEFVTGS